MATSSGDFASEQYGRITTMAKAISNDETRFRFAIGQIRLIEESLEDGSDKTILVKRLVNWALQFFNKIGDFNCDVRMLYLWKLLGKYSVELKMEGVLEKVNELGFFKSAPEFYFIWAEHLAEKTDRSSFDAVVSLCRENCHFTQNSVDELFGPLIREHFNEDYHGDTADFLEMLNHKSATPSNVHATNKDAMESNATELDKSSDSQKPTTSVYTALEFSMDKPKIMDCSPLATPVTRNSAYDSFKNVRMIDFGAEDRSGTADFSSMELGYSPCGATPKKSISNYALEKSYSLIDDGPSMTLCKKIELGNQHFHIHKLIHEGEFSKVFLATTDDDKPHVLKQQVQSFRWEMQIIKELKNRLPQYAHEFIMQMGSAYNFSNLSVIVRDYYPIGTLQDLTVAYKNFNLEMSGLLVTFFGLQLANLLDQVHSAKIIHARLKPGIIYLTQPLFSFDTPLDELLCVPSIKIAGWGKSFDMKLHEDGKQFVGRSESKGVYCVEMISEKPWNYQVDFYGFVRIFHFLMLGDEITTVRSQGTIRPVRAIKRGMTLRSMWMKIFDEFLNISDCESLPSWSQICSIMQEKLQKEVKEKPDEWRKTLDDYNTHAKNIQ